MASKQQMRDIETFDQMRCEEEGEEPYVDEDLLPYYKCVKCGRNVCKDEVNKKLGKRKVICIDCER